MIKTYGRLTEQEIANWTYKKTDKQGRKIFISPDQKYKICFFPNTIYGWVVKNKWYIRG